MLSSFGAIQSHYEIALFKNLKSKKINLFHSIKTQKKMKTAIVITAHKIWL